ncbi:fibronectin type III domain-containing protein [Runella sp.]|uniref:fibronectin type III domain-containing protein n=1 Tax=Runella sp. TaxID=1960881 RepID=UPI003D0F9AAC
MRLYVSLMVVLGLVNLNCFAQTTDNYPVQTTVYFGAPTTQRLSEWFTSDQRLFVQLLLKDLTKPSVSIYLRWQLEGPGMRIATRPGYVPPAFISLTPGLSTRLNGTDLAAHYFSPSLLETEGLDPQEAYNTSLPEGFYTFSVQAFEASTGQVVSNTAQTFLVLSSPQPPLLNLPVSSTSVPVSALQKVLFQWTPRHFATPQSQVVYRLKVCRVPDGEEPNEQIMLTCAMPVLDKTDPGTSLPGDITGWIQPLEPGQRYAVQVQAIDLTNQLTNFTNQGYSQVSWFRYGQECVPPASFTIQSVTADRVRLNWQTPSQAQAYVVEYKAETATEWTSEKVYGTTYMATGLQNKTTYLFRLRSDCGGLVPSAPGQEQAWNISQEVPEPAPEWPKELLQPELINVQTVEQQAVPVTTLQELYVNYPVPAGNTSPVTPNAGTSTSVGSSATAINGSVVTKLKIPDCALRAGSFADCQPTHPVIPLPTGEELTALSVGDVLGIYDFALIVTKVGESPGFSGEGLVRLPFLGNAMMPMEFKGVRAKKGEEGTNGGCVYAIDAEGYVQSKNNVSAKELMEQRQSLIQAVVRKSNPTAFVSTLQQALQQYDLVAKAIREANRAGQTVTPEQVQQVVQYTVAILQGSEVLKTSLGGLESDNTLAIGMLADLKTLTDELTANQTTINKGQAVPVIDELEAKYQALFERLSQLTASPIEPPTVTSTGRITDVSIGNIDTQSAKIAWRGSKSFARYTVLYAAEGEGELTQTVTSPELALKSLKPGRKYTLKIFGYDANGALMDTYGPALFVTPSNTLPAPENLAYTVQADGSVRITWAKNSLHQRFKLTYKTADGEERTLYPTTNSATLTGLDLSRIYAYDVTAYGKDQQVSDLALGTLNELQPCDGFSIETPKVNANGGAIFNTSGCLNAPGNETGQITWYYRTDQNALKNLVGNELKIDGNGKDKEGEPIVQGIMNHGIIAECKTSAQACTSEWKNLDVCFWALFHTKPPEAIPSEDGVMTTIHSNLACYDLNGPGSIRWSNGMTGSSITVELSAVQEYTATCYMKNGTIPCASVTYSVKKQECTDFAVLADRTLINRKDNVLLTANSCFGTVTWSSDGSDAGIGNRLYVRPEKTTAYRAICKAGQISCIKEVTVMVAPVSCADFSVTASVTLLNAGEAATLTALNCKGTVDWGTAGKGPQVTVRPTATTTYTADCTYGNAVCPAQTVQLQIRPESPFKIWANMYEVIGDERTTIYTGGCGAATWADGYTLKAEKLSPEGDIALATPKNLSAQAGTYAISCFSNQCSPVCQIGQTQIIEIKKRPDCSDFRVGATQFSLPKGGTTLLLSVGCSGTVMWDNNLGTGPNFRVSPENTTTYTAVCSDNHCPKSVTVNVTDAACQDFLLTVPQPDFPLSTAEKWIQPAITGCQGNVIWKDGEGKILPLQQYNGDRYYITRWDRTATYSVECAATGCKHSFTINAPVASPFSLTASPAQIAAGQSAVLTAAGCDGTVTWQQVPPLFILNGNTVRPNQTTTYRATCQTTANKTSSSFVTVSVVADANCTFAANASPSLVGNDGNRSATLVASGCAGEVRWDQNAGTGAEVSVLPAQTTTYTATCTTAGTACTAEVTVAVVPCEDFTIDIIDNAVLSAAGCTGEVFWEGQNLKANTFVPASAEAAVYTATCLSTGCQAFVFFAPPPAALPCKAFVAKATPNPIYKGENAVFSATGCEAGTVRWSNGQTQSSFTQTNIRADITYSVDCFLGSDKIATAEVTLKVILSAPGEVKCRNFTLTAVPLNATQGPPYPAGTSFQLTPVSCPGRIEWIDLAGPTVQPDQSTFYSANCYDGTTICNSASVRIDIIDCSVFENHTDENVGESLTLNKDVGYKDGQWYTCPGKVNWYDDAGYTQLICSLSGRQSECPPIGYRGQNRVYYHECVCTDGKTHRGSVQFRYSYNYSGARKEVVNSSANVEASACLPASLPEAMAGYLTKLICDSKALWQGSDQKALDFYTNLKKAVLGNAILSSYAPDFEKVDPSVLLEVLRANDCQAAAVELAKAFSGNVSVDNFKQLILGTYSGLLEKIINDRIYYIMASGKAFVLPDGAKPRFFQSSVYPNGILQGFELADGRTYIARIFSGAQSEYRFQLMVNGTYQNEYITPNLTVAGNAKAFYLIRYTEAGQCGWRKYVGTYDFVAPQKNNGVIPPIESPPANSLQTDQGLLECSLEVYTAHLQRWLQTKNLTKATVFVADCGTDNVTLVNAAGTSPQANLTPDQAKTKVQNRDFTTDFAIYACKQADGKWSITHNFKTGALAIPQGGNYTGTVAEVETRSNAAAQTVIQNNGVRGQSVDDELFYEELDIIKALVTVKDATLTLCNAAKVPEKFWDSNNADYPQSAFHGPTLSGIGDGAISELKDIPELVGFGLQIATDPTKAKATWNGIKSMTPAKVKKMLLGAAADKIAKYTGGGNIMKHEAGKDGVQLAMFVMGAVKSIGTNAAKIADLEGDVVNKLDEVTDETLDATGNAVEEITGKEINKALKEGNTDGVLIDPAVIENSGIDVAAASATKGRKLTWPELKAFWKRGNDFNTKARLNIWYDFDELWFNHPTKKYPIGHPKVGQPMRFRLDSYSKPQNGVRGKIVSRKATTFSEIQESTFSKYLDELVEKYGQPGTIADRAGVGIFDGDLILEVPDVNLTFANKARFEFLASQKNITIVYKPEL